MLQIATGRFWGDVKRFENIKTICLFSVSYLRESVTLPLGKLDPVTQKPESGAVAEFTYHSGLPIPPGGVRSGVMAAPGGQEIEEQFVALLTVCSGRLWATNKELINQFKVASEAHTSHLPRLSMREEYVPYGLPYRVIYEICAAAFAVSTRTDPVLFDTIVGRLVSAGITVNRQETRKARLQGPNAVAVVQILPQEEGLDYIALEGEEFALYPYDGEVLVNLVSDTEAFHLCAPLLLPGDLNRLRFMERDGVKYFDEDEVWCVHEEKEAEKKREREAQRVVTLELPEEFLDLCDDVKTDPAEVLRGFVADLCDLRSGEYYTNGSDERYLAEQYFERCGYRWNH